MKNRPPEITDDEMNEHFGIDPKKTDKQPEDDFATLLNSITPDQVDAALAEKNSGDDNFVPTGELIKEYPVNPQRQIDLHELNAEEARVQVHYFIENAHAARVKTIRIITGKGLHSQGGKPILKGVVEEKLLEFKRQEKVLAFKWEKTGGSILVYLT